MIARALQVSAICLLASLTACAGSSTAAKPGHRHPRLRPVGHVFVIVLENKNYDETFGIASTAPYLAQTLPAKGQLLTQYHGTGHFSLGNYITMISGQSENPATQADCPTFSDFSASGTGADGQLLGSGCVYPAQVKTIADQLEAAGLTWRGYMQDMGSDPAREAATCGHPAIGTQDATQKATPVDQYATRHNPFMYFHSIIDDAASCSEHVVRLESLRKNLKKIKRTRNYSFITPDLCADGHDETCADPAQLGGYPGIDAFLREWVPPILKSPAMERDGLLLITFDESESGAEACCFIPAGPNTLLQGVYGPGGGRTGAIAISPLIRKGTVNETPYNHYSLLATTEDIFGLPRLGYAANDAVAPFGADVFGKKPH